MRIKNRRGDISTVLIWMIAMSITVYFFYTLMLTNMTTIKYENMSQYARDSLLILETMGEIEKSYLLDCKKNLSDKLNMKTGETLNIYLKVGDEPEYNISSSTTPNTITTDFGDTILIRYEYSYISRAVSFLNNSLRPTVSDDFETMEVELQTISKNRNTSDG